MVPIALVYTAVGCRMRRNASLVTLRIMKWKMMGFRDIQVLVPVNCCALRGNEHRDLSLRLFQLKPGRLRMVSDKYNLLAAIEIGSGYVGQ